MNPVWLLVFVVFTKSDWEMNTTISNSAYSTVISNTYPTRFDCDIHMGSIATASQKDKKIFGYTIPVACVQVWPVRKT
jgi:hypothetical protein